MAMTAFALSVLLVLDQRDTARVLSLFNAANWVSRANAVKELRVLITSDPSLAARDDVRNAVASLLERETAQSTQAQYSTDSNLDFREYYDSALLPLALQLAANGEPNPALLRALVRSTHNPDSQLTAILARHGASILAHAQESAASNAIGDRVNAYALAAAIVAADRERQLTTPLVPSMRTQLLALIRAGLQDPHPVGRREAINAIVIARDREAIPILQHVASTDPDDTGGGNRRFSVRAQASDAVRQLQAVR